MPQEQDYILEKIRERCPDVPEEQLQEIVKYQMRQRDLHEFLRCQPKPAPILEVNWGEVVPTLGAHLSPEFTIRAPGHYAAPFIYFWKDSRITDKGWDEYPAPLRMGDSQWHFCQQLCLEADGNSGVRSEYHLQFKIIFPENDGQEPYCYCATIKLATGIAETSSGIPSSINVSGGAVVSVYGGVKNGMHIKAEDNALISVDEGCDAKFQTKADSYRVVVSLTPDMEMLDRTPKKRLLKPEHAFHEDQRLVLTHPDGRMWHLFAESEITIGRHNDNHIPVQWLDRKRQPPREGSPEYILGTCISRHHCSLNFEGEKVYITDHSTMGTFANKQALPREKNYFITWGKLPFNFDIAGILRIRLSKLRNRCLVTGKNNKDFPDPENLYRFMLSRQNEENEDFTQWNLAQNVDVDAVQITRIKKLVADAYCDILLKQIPKECDQQEFLQACRACGESPQAASEEYFLVLRSLSVGCDSRDGIVLNDPGVRKGHSQVLSCGNGFWIENLKQDGIAIDGIPLKPKELVRLTSGMTLRIGNCVLTVSKR